MSNDSSSINCALQDGIWHICINRPQKRNALTIPMFLAIAEGLKEADLRDDVRSVVVTGAGDIFCAGHDLNAFGEWPQGPGDPVPTFLHAVAEVRKPLVIAAQGSATGIGATWLPHADWVVTSAEATFRFPFIDLGIVPEAASTQLLQHAVGIARAKRLLLGGEKFTGAEAYQWGLVAEVVTPAEIVSTAWERAKFLGSKDPTIFRRVKDWLHPSKAYQQRIDDEVDEINAAIGRRRKTTESMK